MANMNYVYQVKVRGPTGVSAFRLTTSRSPEALRAKIESTMEGLREVNIVRVDNCPVGHFFN